MERHEKHQGEQGREGLRRRQGGGGWEVLSYKYTRPGSGADFTPCHTVSQHLRGGLCGPSGLPVRVWSAADELVHKLEALRPRQTLLQPSRGSFPHREPS